MDTSLYIDLPKKEYLPGETVSGTIYWALETPPRTLRLTLGWWTEGRGTRDESVEASRDWQTSQLAGEKPFSFTLPLSPYSFSGSLIRLQWALELTAQGGDKSIVEMLVVSPTGAVIELSQLDKSRAHAE